ncbi:MAG TPA: PAS domain S-box protein [Gemmataceae bacterium]|nr:PAS domain S-box protein [Gemmataceae bacterium]
MTQKNRPPAARRPDRPAGRARPRPAPAAADPSTEPGAYRLLFERNPQPMWVFDRDSLAFLAVNPAAVRHYGYSREEFLTLTALDLRPPEEAARLVLFLDELKKRPPEGPWPAGLWKHRKKDGTLIDVEISSCPVPFGGRPAVLAILYDVTERRRQEAALRRSEDQQRLIAELTSDYAYTCTVSPDGQIDLDSMTAGFQRVTGYTMEELQAIGGWPALIHPDDVAAVQERLPRLLLGERGVHEVRLVTRGGEVRWIRYSTRPIWDEREGRVVRLLGAVQDISEQKRAEEALRRAHAELEERVWERTAELSAANANLRREIAEREAAQEQARRLREELAHVARFSTMGEMAAGLAHELNQPLAAIVSYVDGCVRRLEAGEASPGDLAEALRRAAAQAARAGQIIHRLRGFVARREVCRAPADVNELVRAVLQLAGPDLRAAGVRVRLELARGLPPVGADAVQVEQVILNLVRNGAEAMAEARADGRELMLATGPAEEGAVRVAVSDRGCGLSAEVRARLFQPFVTTKSRGLGLGLVISQSIIEAHGGRIWAEPNPEGGTTFCFTLPVAGGRAQP